MHTYIICTYLCTYIHTYLLTQTTYAGTYVLYIRKYVRTCMHMLIHNIIHLRILILHTYVCTFEGTPVCIITFLLYCTSLLLLQLLLQVLKKHKKDLDRSQALWTNTTPVASCAYHESCSSYLKYVLCHCCVSITDWRVTGQGIRWRVNRASINCCGESEFNSMCKYVRTYIRLCVSVCDRNFTYLLLQRE